MSKESYTKEWLIHEIAAKASFTVSDIRIIMDTFIQIIEKIIKEDNELVIPGLFSLYVKKIKAHKGFDAVRKQPLELKESHRVVFTASRSLLDELKEDKKENIETIKS